MELTIQTLAEIVGGRLRMAAMPPLGGWWEPIAHVVTDLREVGPGDVLIASDDLLAQRPCWNAEAFDRGALGVIHAGPGLEPWAGRFSIQVQDTAWALWQVARTARSEFNGQIITVAGSVGKTITCSMIRTVLGLASGTDLELSAALPSQVLRLANSERCAVLETDAEDDGEFDAAMHLSMPHVFVGIHLPDSVHATSIMLPDDSQLIVGPTAGALPTEKRHTAQITFGRHSSCDVTATHVLCRPGELSFVVDGQLANLPVWGRHLLDNALAAWAVGRAMGVCDADIATRLARVHLPAARCEVMHASGMTFINDNVGMSPQARFAALELLDMVDAARRIVVCQSDHSDDAGHDLNFNRWNEFVEVGGADLLIALGHGADDIIAGATRAGMPASHCMRCADSHGAAKEISTFLQKDDVLLFSGVDLEVVQRVLAPFQNTVSDATARSAAA